MHQDVIKDTAQRIFGGATAHRCHFYCLADGDAQAAHILRVLCQDAAPGIGEIGGTGMNRSSEGFHQIPAVRFLLVADLDHEDFDIHVEERARHCQR